MNVQRTPEMKARRIAQMVKSPAELRALLRQFSSDHHAGLMERLRPHLNFDPDSQETDNAK